MCLCQRQEGVSKNVRLIPGGGKQMLTGLINGGAKARAVYAKHLAMLLDDAPANNDGINVAALCRMHHGAKGIAGRVEVDIANIDQNEIRLFSWRQAPYLVQQPCTGSTIDSRRFEKLGSRQRGQRESEPQQCC